MTGPELDYVRDTIEQEGFDYTFTGYSDFEDIRDTEFHRLREEYVAAKEALATFLGVSE